MEKEKKVLEGKAESTKKAYSSPRAEKHENLKEITLLSFNPPTE